MFLILLIFVVAVVFYIVRRYNALQTLAHGVREAHANVMASMKKRLDLVNKLVDIAKGYADHEKLTHLSISSAATETGMGDTTAASGVLTQVMRMATQYPELKANAAYQQLMAQLDVIESDLQTKREAYNAMVRVYNSSIGQLPVSLYAKQLGFKSAPYFDVENADSLERMRDFHSDDAEHLKELLAQGSKRIADSGRRVADESVRLGKLAVEKGMEIQQRHLSIDAADTSGRASGHAPDNGTPGHQTDRHSPDTGPSSTPTDRAS